ncbi:MAG: hypothetical protein M3R70_03235 [Actinomycetota bacterium]|nr:hypothetical protein [Actinomycetota bacterium]
MKTKSYGVVWHEGDLLAHGKLEFLPQGLLLEGLSDSVLTQKKLAYCDLRGVTTGRGAQDRIKGLPTLILEPRGGPPITITTVAQTSLISEIAERLAKVRLRAVPPPRTVTGRELPEGLSSAPTPGPGDSDGGDIFAP